MPLQALWLWELSPLIPCHQELSCLTVVLFGREMTTETARRARSSMRQLLQSNCLIIRQLKRCNSQPCSKLQGEGDSGEGRGNSDKLSSPAFLCKSVILALCSERCHKEGCLFTCPTLLLFCCLTLSYLIATSWIYHNSLVDVQDKQWFKVGSLHTNRTVVLTVNLHETNENTWKKSKVLLGKAAVSNTCWAGLRQHSGAQL